MSETTKNKLYWCLGISVILFVMFLYPRTSRWEGEGTISAYPDSGSVKNYRLPAYIYVTRKERGWFNHQDTYEVDQASWPNGGIMSLYGCIVKENEQAACPDQNDEEYIIEVNTAPEPPENDYYE